jgi:fibronectin type 3 domain-containing protein
MFGPGKYDEITTYVREKTKAKIAVVVIVDGNQGNGFSVQAVDLTGFDLLSNILRQVADQLDADLKPKGRS